MRLLKITAAFLSRFTLGYTNSEKGTHTRDPCGAIPWRGPVRGRSRAPTERSHDRVFGNQEKHPYTRVEQCPVLAACPPPSENRPIDDCHDAAIRGNCSSQIHCGKRAAGIFVHRHGCAGPGDQADPFGRFGHRITARGRALLERAVQAAGHISHDHERTEQWEGDDRPGG